MISLPTPGQEKIVSVTTANASVEPNSRPNTVTIGIEISRSTWRRRIVHSLSPAARANFTVSVSMTSRVPARARRIIIANLNSDEIERGQDQVMPAVEREEAPLDAEQRRRLAAPARRQPAERHRESQDQHQSDPEGRHREAEHRDRHDQLRDGAAGLVAGDTCRAGRRQAWRRARRSASAPASPAGARG